MTHEEIAALREQRAAAYDHMQAVLAEVGNGGMSDEQDRAYRTAERDFDALTDRIEAGRASLGDDANTPAILRSMADAGRLGGPVLTDERSLRGNRPLAREQRVADWLTANDVRDERFADDNAAEFSLGRLVRGAVTGQWTDADLERRAFGSGADATGGVLVPSPLAATTIDMLRNESVVIEAGARTVPMPSGELSIPRLASGFDQAQWRDELENVAEGDATFERVKFEAKTLAEIITLPYELVEDMTGEGAEIIERAIRVALALKLDKAALYADGTAKDPVGIKSQPGVTIESIATDGAAPTNYAPFTKAAFALRRKNVKPTGFVYSERTAETVAGFVATDNQPLNPPRAIADLPHLSTNQVPDDLDEGTSTGVASDLFTANWADLWIGVRPEIGIRVETQRVLDNMAVKVLAYLRADVQLAHAESFHVTTGLLEDAS